MLAPVLRELPSRLLAQAGTAAAAISGAKLSAAGFDHYQFSILATLEHWGVLDQAAISARTGLDRSDVAIAVASLEVRGLVERQNHPADRRRRRVEITVDGLTAITRLKSDLEVVQRDIFSSLSHKETSELRRMCILILQSLRN